MIKLKQILNEYITNPIIQLKNYLNMSALEQKEDLAIRYPYLVKEFGTTYFDPEVKRFIANNQNEDYEIVDEFKRNFPNEYIDFLDWLDHQLESNRLEPIPTWHVMQYTSMIKNQWLIHFSDDADDIWADQTFQYGLDDLNDIAYTTSYSKEAKATGGYNFAYDIIDYVKFGRSSYRSGDWKYGKEAVLFRASGVKAHHYGDEEPQVIFWGQTANDIVYLRNPDDWQVVNSKTHRIIFRAQTLPEVVKWVISNFNQYKNALLP
jgi:hypothetical protein